MSMVVEKMPAQRGTFVSLLTAALLLAAGGVRATPIDGAVCRSCEELFPGISICNAGLGGGEAASGAPVRYIDGVAVIRSPSIAAPSDVSGWAFHLSYLNRAAPEDSTAIIKEDAGFNWVTNVPRLEPRPTGELWLITGSMNAVRFHSAGSNTWLSRTGVYVPIALAYVSGSYYWKLEGARGGQALFHYSGSLRGRLASIADPRGNSWTFSYYGSGDGAYAHKLEEIYVTRTAFAWKFEYRETDGLLETVKVIQGDPGNPRFTMSLGYYGGLWSGKGTIGDLRYVKVTRGSYRPRVTYFRYHTGGADGRLHDLKYVIGPDDYEALVDRHNLTALDPNGVASLEALGDAQIDGASGYFFENRFLYDGYGRVKKEVVRTGSCGCLGSQAGSVGAYEYRYAVYSRPSVPPGNTNPAVFNTTYLKVKVKLPGGNRRYLELNRMGAALLEVDVEVDESGQEGVRFWARRWEYDADGLLTKAIHPSATNAESFEWVGAWETTWPTGSVTVRGDAGLVESHEYAKWAGGDRKRSGKLVKKELWIGRDPGEDPARRRTVVEHTYGAAEGKLLEPTTTTVYAEAGAPLVTSFAYEWNGTYPDQIARRTTTWPEVTKPAGSVFATRIEEFGASGQETGLLKKVTVRKLGDQGGRVVQYAYWQDGTLRPMQRRVDPAGLDLKEYYQYDSWGNRTHEILYGPDGSTPVRVRRWVHTTLSGGTTGDGILPRDVTLAHDHYDAASQVPRDGDVGISVRSLDGRLVEEARGRPASPTQPIGSDFVPAAVSLEGAFLGQLFERTISTYDGPALVERAELLDAGDPSGARHTTVFQYDDLGRLVGERDAAGTIRRLVRDARGRVTEVLVGVEEEDLTHLETREYDGGADGGDGLLTRVERPIDGGEEEASRVTVIEHDAWNRPVLRAEAADALSWRVVETEYDDLDRPSATASYLGATDGSQWWHFYMGALEDRLWRLEARREYDERGRLWKETVVWKKVTSDAFDPETAPPGTAYETKLWHDEHGAVVKVKPPGWNYEKLAHDAAGRLIASYRSFDVSEGDTLADAMDVSDDIVLWEERYARDRAGREVLRTTYERLAGETEAWAAHEGPLSSTLSAHARASYVASWYTPSGRLRAVADYGDNGGAAPSPGSDPPPQGPDVLVTGYEYGHGHVGDPPEALYAGQPESTSWVKVTDPAGKLHATFSDNLGREIRVIRNYAPGGAPGTEEKEGVAVQVNVTSSFSHDGLGRVIRAVAHELAGGPVEEQVTEYRYEVRKAVMEGEGSALDTNELLARVVHGDATGPSRQTLYAYNRAGEVTWTASGDAGSPPAFRAEHRYARDLLGRVVQDEVTAADAGVDREIDILAFAFDSHGRLVLAESLARTNGTTSRVNAVSRSYDLDGNLELEAQNHGGGWSKTVRYRYSRGEDGENLYPIPRISEIEYPSGRKVKYARSGQSASPGWEAKDWVTGRPSRISDERTGESAGHVFYNEYMGLGRVLETRFDDDPEPGSPLAVAYVTGSTAPSPEGVGVDRWGRVPRLYAAAGAAGVVDLRYSYDRFHAPESREDFGPLSLDEAYAYDDVGRLLERQREGAPARTWELTAAGNWKALRDGTTPADERGHNDLNEITARSQGLAVPAYDLEGNTTGIPLDAPAGGSFEAVYDGWNRLVEVIDTGPDPDVTVARYERDALGRIVEDRAAGLHYHYSDSWQVLSVYADGGGALRKEFVWGTRYIDEILSTVTYSGENPGRRFHIQDANFNVVATLGWSGSPPEFGALELVTYDPYGMPEFWTKSGSSWVPSASPVSTVGSEFLFQGRWLQALQGASGEVRLYEFRNRAYGPGLGRFLQRDPIGVWGDAANAGNGYGFVGGAPQQRVDPVGLRLEVASAMLPIVEKFRVALEKALNDLCPCDSWEVSRYGTITRTWKYVGKQEFCDCYCKHKAGCNLLDDLHESTRTIRIRSGWGDHRNELKPSGVVRWDYQSRLAVDETIRIAEKDDEILPPAVVLGHELAHARHFQSPEGLDASREEREFKAVRAENQIRREQGIGTMRKYYDFGNPIGSKEVPNPSHADLDESDRWSCCCEGIGEIWINVVSP